MAFPGGKREKDESSTECAIRETKEEIGLDLSNKEHFLPLGKVISRPTHSTGYVGLWTAYGGIAVSVFAWLQLVPEELPLQLQVPVLHCIVVTIRDPKYIQLCGFPFFII